MSVSKPLAVGADLGSTTIKAGVLERDGRLARVRAVPAPPLRGEGGLCEGDPEAYARAAEGLLQSVAADLPRGTPLGVATQRSSFTIWSRADGRLLAPLVSWQDRRAAEWCERHRDLEPEVVRKTGLLLSAHYVGPKLAAMQETDRDFRAALHDPRSALGTLETLLLWRWSRGARHETDATVAARTALLDLAAEDWDADLLRRFGVPRAVLPQVVRTRRDPLSMPHGLVVTATLSDQAAAALAVFDPAHPAALVNLGTGAFVLCPAARPDRREPGYLLAPILSARPAAGRFALEGTVNGAGPAVDDCDRPPTDLPREDPEPQAFALPDRAGLGAPFWRPEIGLVLSEAARRLAPAGRRRVMLEGILFRVRQILEDLGRGALPDRVVVAGGLVRDPAVGPGLAALLGRPVELLLEPESGLLGAARVAAGIEPFAASPTRVAAPGPAGSYLPAKFPTWRLWLDGLLAGTPPHPRETE